MTALLDPLVLYVVGYALFAGGLWLYCARACRRREKNTKFLRFNSQEHSS